MVTGHTYHSLTEADLAALANSRYTPDTVRQLQVAQFSRNALLFEAIRRRVAAAGDATTADVVKTATLLLSQIQEEQPELVRKLLVLPQFGLWAASCLVRLQGAAEYPYLEEETRLELGCVAGFAAAAGLLAGHSFHIQLPVRDSAVYLPTFTPVPLASSAGLTWTQISSEGKGSAVLAGAKTAVADLTPVSRLEVGSRGLVLSVALDQSDLFLARLGPVVSPLSPDSVRAWRNALQQAWEILVREDQLLASAIAAGLTTLVPFRQAALGPSASAASGWAWGAIALTLPADPLAFAETLIHEFQHLVLSAVDDIVPLAEADNDELFYSPWRDDPRPFSSLLQGAYAFFGVTRFWQGSRAARSSSARRRAEGNFALGRRNVSDALGIIARSGKLSETGQAFIGEMERSSSEWLADHVSAPAENYAQEIALEHKLRWRLANLSPDRKIIDVLAHSWLSNPSAAPRQLGIPIALRSSPVSDLADRSGFLQQMFTSSAEPVPPDAEVPLGPGDLAFMRGHMFEAGAAYAQAASQGDDRDAWIGLVLALRRMGTIGEDWLAGQRVEVVAALSDRVRAITGQSPDARALLMWAQPLWSEKA
jgi:HEXXH motif-containing protein